MVEFAVPLASVNFGDLGRMIIASTFAGLAATTIFAVVILASGHSIQARRVGRNKAAAWYLTGALVAVACFIGLIVLAIDIMLTKH
jgi:hypothetical protein